MLFLTKKTFLPILWVNLNMGILLEDIRMNITLSIDEAIVKKVRKIAFDKDTTLTAMVREYLETLASSDMSEREERIRKLNETVYKLRRPVGKITWSREDLYER